MYRQTRHWLTYTTLREGDGSNQHYVKVMAGMREIQSSINSAWIKQRSLNMPHGEITSRCLEKKERHRWMATCRHWHRCSLVLEDILQTSSCGNRDIKKRLLVPHASLTKCATWEAWERTVLGGLRNTYKGNDIVSQLWVRGAFTTEKMVASPCSWRTKFRGCR